MFDYDIKFINNKQICVIRNLRPTTHGVIIIR